MKTRIFAGIAAVMAAMLLIATPACGGSGNGGDEYPDTATYTLRSDTLSDLYGRLVGRRLADELNYYIQSSGDTTYNIDEFVAGVEKVVGQRRPMVNISGMALGLRIEAGDLVRLDKGDVKIDRAKLLEAMRAAMEIDSIGPFDQERNSAMYEKALKAFEADSTSAKAAEAVAEAYGKMVGTGVAAELIARGDVSGDEKNDFIRGVEAVVGCGRPQEYFAGLSSGINMAQDIVAAEHQGVNVRRNIVVDRLRAAFEADSMPAVELQRLNDAYIAMRRTIADEFNAREDARLATTDEAIQNIKTGEALVAKMKKSNPAATTTPSGLTVLIENPGTGDRISANDTIVLKYVGSHLDGKVFDSNNRITMVPSQLVKGMAEGLQMLGKGGKATFWIPGNLGYGGRGAQQAGIGPMETIVFDVEILDTAK